MSAADWLTSDEMTAALARIKAENDERCSECEELLTDDNRCDVEFYFSGWGQRPLCSDCGREMLGID
jgi:hypothetical protein